VPALVSGHPHHTRALPWVRRCSAGEIEGEAVYDALIAYAARQTGVDRLVTFNADDFRRVWPEGAAKVVVP